MQNQFNKTASEVLLPMPKRVIDREGAFRIHQTTSIASDPLFCEVADLAAQLLDCKRGGEDILFKLNDQLEQESYLLSVSKKQIVITASDSCGAFRGFSTLRRLALTMDNLISCCTIEDSADFTWRGFMIDSSRHYFSIDFIKKIIDIASLFHLNRFHWHLTDDQGWRIPSKKWPKLQTISARRREIQYMNNTYYGRIYTREEILEVQKYAHQRHMLVIPEFDTPGHVSALLAAYPEFGCTSGPYEVQGRWGIFDEVLCAGNENTLTLLNSIIEEIAELFTDPYIHIGGDECPHTAWDHCPKCQEKMKQLGLTESRQLQSYLTKEVSRMVQKVGKRPIGWDEVLEGTETLSLPENLIVMSWRGTEGGLEASKRGHEVIMCPNTEGCYFDYKHIDSEEEIGNLGVSTLKQVASFNPWPPQMEKPLGAQANLWSEKVTSSRLAEYLLMPRLMLFAERLWNPQNPQDSLRKLPILHHLCDRLQVLCYRGPIE